MMMYLAYSGIHQCSILVMSGFVVVVVFTNRHSENSHIMSFLLFIIQQKRLLGS
jgi:hypothetical protein